jgi:hypothetical protein
MYRNPSEINLKKSYKIMSVKLKHLKASCLPIVLFLFILTTTGCKKDKLEVNEVKEYSEVGHIAMGAYDGGWELTLKPDGVAEVNPGGDIRYGGTYKINGSKIKVKTEQNSGSYTFEIISESKIREQSSGVTLGLK